MIASCGICFENKLQTTYVYFLLCTNNIYWYLKFFEIYSDRSGDFYAGGMSHDPPQIQIPEKWTFKQGNDTKKFPF